MEPSPGGCIYSTALAPTDGGDGKSQRVRKFTAILCHLGISEATLTEVSPVWLPKQDMNKDDPNRHTNMIRELAGPHPSTKSYQQLMSAENERNFFPRSGDTDTSLGNVFIQVILWTTQGMCV